MQGDFYINIIIILEYMLYLNLRISNNSFRNILAFHKILLS